MGLVALLAGCIDISAGERAPETAEATSVAGEGETIGSTPRRPDRDWADERPQGPAPDEEVPGTALFAHGRVHDVVIELDDDAEDDLASDPLTEVPADVTVDGFPWPEVGVQLKGTTSYRPLGQKASFKLDFGAFVPGQEIHGLRRLILNNMVQDGSMLREHVAFRLYELAGAPSLRHGYARVWVGDEYHGLYGLVETPDQDLLDRLWPASKDGNLYEGGFGADFIRGRERRFQLEEEGVWEPITDIEELVSTFDDTSGDAEVDALYGSLVAGREFLAFLAVDLASGNNDGYAVNRNNFHAYHGDDGLWRLLPWGLDQAFHAHNDVHDPSGWQGRLALDCFRSEACEERAEAAILEVLEVWESPDLLTFAREAAELVAPLCAEDPMREEACDVDGVLRFLEERPAEVRDQL